MQDDLGEHTVQSRQSTNPNRSGTLLTLRDSLKELSEMIQKMRQDELIIRAGKQLEHGPMRINHNNMTVHRGLKNQSTVIILHDLKIGIKQADKSGKDYTDTVIEVALVISLDDIMDAV